MNEFSLIERYFKRKALDAAVQLGVGDDAAVLAPRSGLRLAVSADMLVAGRHFFADADPFDIGFKSLAVNLSDMAAMGARPLAATLCLALPAADPVWLERFAAGFWSLAERHGLDLVGGDTTAGPLTIAIQIWGELPADKALLRSGARAGDDIWVSGCLGSAALGLEYARGSSHVPPAAVDHCLERLLRPEPRVGLGQALLPYASSAIDISDGLLADLGHILERSACGAEIDWQDVPLHEALEARRDSEAIREIVLGGGDDYELCFTAPRALAEHVVAAGEALGVRLSRIGRIRSDGSLIVKGKHGEHLPIGRRGFDHFGAG